MLNQPFFEFVPGQKVEHRQYVGQYTFGSYTTDTKQFALVKDFAGCTMCFYSSDLKGVKPTNRGK